MLTILFAVSLPVPPCQTFFKQFAPDLAGSKPNVIGPNEESNPGVEASLGAYVVKLIVHASVPLSAPHPLRRRCVAPPLLKCPMYRRCVAPPLLKCLMNLISVWSGACGFADIQYIMAIGAGATTTFWSTAGSAPDNPENEPFLTWLEAMKATKDDQLPHVYVYC